jgi:hypothetical protein
MRLKGVRSKGKEIRGYGRKIEKKLFSVEFKLAHYSRRNRPTIYNLVLSACMQIAL